MAIRGDLHFRKISDFLTGISDLFGQRIPRSGDHYFERTSVKYFSEPITERTPIKMIIKRWARTPNCGTFLFFEGVLTALRLVWLPWSLSVHYSVRSASAGPMLILNHGVSTKKHASLREYSVYHTHHLLARDRTFVFTLRGLAGLL